MVRQEAQTCSIFLLSTDSLMSQVPIEEISKMYKVSNEFVVNMKSQNLVYSVGKGSFLLSLVFKNRAMSYKNRAMSYKKEKQ